MPNINGGKRPNAGRKAGIPNKITAGIKALAQNYTAPAMAELGRIAIHGESEQARVAAIRELFDRGYGRATQFLDIKHSNAYDELTLKQLVELASILRSESAPKIINGSGSEIIGIQAGDVQAVHEAEIIP